LFAYVVLLGLTAAVGAGALAVGHGDLGSADLRSTLLRLRGLRIAAAFIAGAGLSVGGVIVQALFRNPLASPDVIGTTAGASLGGQAVLFAFNVLPVALRPARLAPELLVPLGCLAGALASLAVLLAVVRRRPSFLVVLLTGFVLSSLFLSLGSFLITLAQESWEVGRAIVAFTLGGVGGVGERHILLALPLVTAGVVAAWNWGRPLDLLLSGEEEATTLGVDVSRVRFWCVVWVAFLTAAAVSIGGNVAFVGLIIPHAVRPFVGLTTRRLVPAAALAGGTFLVLADLLGRALPSRGEVPLSVVTGLVGAPVFIVLLVRGNREGRLG
jgi:iron complex transport system permease protein